MFDELSAALGESPILFLVALVTLSTLATVALITMVSVASVQWRRIREAEEESVLKQEMLRRGMGAEEIERTIAASSRQQPIWTWPPLGARRGLRVRANWQWPRFSRVPRWQKWCGR